MSEVDPQLPPLRNFRNLSTLYLFSCHPILPSYSSTEVAPAIEASPQLENLAISNYLDSTQLQFIDEPCKLFQIPFGSSLPRLRELRLMNAPLHASVPLGSVIKKLRCINISTNRISPKVDIAWAALWTALEHERVKLTEVKVGGTERAMDEMLSYLLSYTGLEILEIQGVSMVDLSSEDDAGDRFWLEVVPKHHESLVSLCIEYAHEGAWCYGPHASRALSKCSRLEHLTLVVGSASSDWTELKFSCPETRRNISLVGPPDVDHGSPATCVVSSTPMIPSSSAYQS